MNVGAAQIDITPDFPVELSGFALRPQPASGIADPIFARALYLEDQKERLLWIACDVIAFERDLVDSVRSWAKKSLDLEPRQVLLSATHTHTAPATIHLNAAGNYSVKYVATLSKKLREVAQRAAFAPDPCDFVQAQAPLELAIDRRGKPTAHVDAVVSAIAFKRRDTAEYQAGCVNYAMHPVTFGRDFNQISADWCGSTSFGVSSSLAGEPITLISNGAAGNLNPPQMDVPAAVVASYGQRVADAILPALQAALSQPVKHFAVRSVTLGLPLDHLDAAGIDRAADKRLSDMPADWVLKGAITEAVETWRCAMHKTIADGGDGGKEVPFEIQVIRINDAYIVAVNGEMFSRFTAMLRERTGKNLFVVGYANAAFGYIPTSEAYDEGGYEVETAHFFYNSFRPKRGSLDMLVDRARDMIEELARS